MRHFSIPPFLIRPVSAKAARGGFISLPIILLVLFVLGLSYGFYQTLAKERQWHYQQQVALANQKIWHAFETDIVWKISLPQGKELARLSSCLGFCSLREMSEEQGQRKYTFTQHDKTESLHWLLTKMSATSPYYRLCAKHQNEYEIQCWWYEENTSGMLILIGHMPFSLLT